MIARRIIVAGRVQGVGFRDALIERATILRLTGWVRNRRDATVEALLQGAPKAVESAIDWARAGPPAARVTGIEVHGVEPDLTRSSFERLPTF
ncbi:MAG TPA: acylphosphatase [Burkholderiales bacterium]|nr:acylphosphatase [Burkholderiales bacterium]